MSHRDRLQYLAAGLGAVLTLYGLTFVASWIAGEGVFGCNHTKQHSVEGTSKTYRGYDLRPRVNAGYEEPDCAQPKTKEYADLCEQRRMADAAAEASCYAGWQTVVALLGFIAVLGTVFFAWRAAEWAKKAAIATENSWKAIERPWISIHIDAISVRTAAEKTEVDFQCRVENVGNAPASNIYVATDAVLSDLRANELMAAFSPGHHTGKSKIGISLFPGEKAEGSELLITEVIKRTDADDQDRFVFFPIVIGLVEYRSPNHDSSHITTISVFLGVATDDPSMMMAFDWSARSYAQSEISARVRYTGNRIT